MTDDRDDQCGQASRQSLHAVEQHFAKGADLRRDLEDDSEPLLPVGLEEAVVARFETLLMFAPARHLMVPVSTQAF